ncbi:MAG TPA: hypothetical protein VG186_07305 [Solirubrobacteraceae bacterium]|nr:hypothetical protein [Solirubrobacteraceae bacterium]
MAGKDQHSDSSNGSAQASNVVRLRPRQWLEPDEALVPIGAESKDPEPKPDPTPISPNAADADGRGHPDALGHASTWLGAGEETVPIVRPPAPKADNPDDATNTWAASDFWGEDAAYVHNTLEAPIPPPSSTEDPPPQRRHFTNPHKLLRVPALAAITVAAAALLATIINGLGSAPTAHRQTAPGASLHADAHASATAASGPAQGTETATQRLRTTAATPRHHTALAHHRAHSRPATHTKTQHKHRATRSRAATVVVRYVSPPPASAPSPTTYSTGAASQSTSPSSSGPAGPTGTVAKIGAGTSSSG